MTFRPHFTKSRPIAKIIPIHIQNVRTHLKKVQLTVDTSIKCICSTATEHTKYSKALETVLVDKAYQRDKVRKKIEKAAEIQRQNYFLCYFLKLNSFEQKNNSWKTLTRAPGQSAI